MYRPSAEEFDDVHVLARSAEPFPKPDHKAKKHGRPTSGYALPRRSVRDAGRDRFRSHRCAIEELNAWGARTADGGCDEQL